MGCWRKAGVADATRCALGVPQRPQASPAKLTTGWHGVVSGRKDRTRQDSFLSFDRVLSSDSVLAWNLKVSPVEALAGRPEGSNLVPPFALSTVGGTILEAKVSRGCSESVRVLECIC